MINTESAISYTSMMFSDQRLQQLCGPHFIPWHKRAQLDTSSMFHRRKPWQKLIDVAELGRNVIPQPLD